jgi:hypothetical protein
LGSPTAVNPIHDVPSIPNSILAALARACTPRLMLLALVAVLFSAHSGLAQAKPPRDAPQFDLGRDGCAYAMSKTETVEVDPESWLATNGRLMLFNKGLFNDTRSKWLKDEAGFTTKADAGWKQVNVPPKPKAK